MKGLIQDLEFWRERALRAEDRQHEMREILLDVDALMNSGNRVPDAIVTRVKREPRSISRRVQDILLETAETHCKNWAYGCGPGECLCRCDRCPAEIKGAGKPKPLA